jgi:broad specificity phosphatase PhoE
LADEGLQQAKETTETLAQYNFKHAFVSPFTRTIQTANQILQKHDILMRLENGVAEYITQEEAHPPVLETILPDFPKIDTNYKSRLLLPKFEPKKGLMERGKQIMKHISDTYSPIDTSKKGFGDILIVTHAAPAIAMVIEMFPRINLCRYED